MSKQMQEYPIRFGELGRAVQDELIRGSSKGKIADNTEVDFRPRSGSACIDAGSIYFVPFALYGTVGEWNFTENRSNPALVMDYSWYMGEEHIHRRWYDLVPPNHLILNDAGLEDFRASPRETWAKGSLYFDGQRFGRVADADMRKDIVIPRGEISIPKKYKSPFYLSKHWEYTYPDDTGKDAVFPGELRNTLVIRNENLLVEVYVKVKEGQEKGVLLAKHDGESGYRLRIDDEGRAEFQISSNGVTDSVATAEAINNGTWHHVIAEVDRATGQMRTYLDGKPSSKAEAGLPREASLDNRADFVVGRSSHRDADYFVGELDFMRVCQGTLEDAKTDIDEIYTWQTDGPWKYDYFGHNVQGEARDAGAIELTE
jgi:hypothetical protein